MIRTPCSVMKLRYFYTTVLGNLYPWELQIRLRKIKFQGTYGTISKIKLRQKTKQINKEMH